jgi:hypothetical protein
MSVFSSLSNTYPTWGALSVFLTSEAGGYLRVDDHSTPEQPFALIRYVKGKSNFSLPHVGSFRSVVWDVLKNEPVSVAPVKSETGESMPPTPSTDAFIIERFIDGVMICGFYDQYNKVWRFHTRSTLNANCRFYSQTKSFRQMFEEGVFTAMTWSNFLASLDPTTQYTWVLQHPENRIVVHVTTPTVVCVQKQTYLSGTLVAVTTPTLFDVAKITVASWSDLSNKLQLENAHFKHNLQGYVIKNGLSFRDYLALYPEERHSANAIVDKWKTISRTVYNLYTDVFKARSLPKAQIPPKYRPFVFGLHNMYINELKPQSKTVDWQTALQYMNTRDTAQALYAINWEVRAQNQQQVIPLEFQGQVGSESAETVPTVQDLIQTAAATVPTYEAQPVTGVV